MPAEERAAARAHVVAARCATLAMLGLDTPQQVLELWCACPPPHLNNLAHGFPPQASRAYASSCTRLQKVARSSS